MSALAGKRVVVVGAGFGGLSAAAHLARAGASVKVFEKAPRRDADAWRGFLGTSRACFERIGRPSLEGEDAGLPGLCRRLVQHGLRRLPLGPFRGSLDASARRHFRSPEMRAFVHHFASYVGGSREKTSAVLAMLAHAELERGSLYPAGGMHAVAVRLATAIEGLGAEIITNVEVIRIEVDGSGRVTGVVTRSRARPGGGVSLAIKSGELAAKALREDMEARG